MRKKLWVVGAIIVGLLAVIIIVFINYTPSLFTSISANSIETAIQKKQSKIIFYGSENCSSCIVAKPIIQKTAKELKIQVYYMDSDDFSNSEFIEKYKISLTPTIIFLQNGEISTYDGNITKENVNDILSMKADNTKVDRVTGLSELSAEAILEKMDNNSDFLLYLGRDDCRDCQAFSPLLKQYLDDKTDAGLYYLNVKATKENTAQIDDIKKQLSLKWVPIVMHIVNGEVTQSFQFLDESYYDLPTDAEKEIYLQNEKNDFKNWMDTYFT